MDDPAVILGLLIVLPIEAATACYARSWRLFVACLIGTALCVVVEAC